MTLIYLISILTLALAATLFVGRLDKWLQKPIAEPYHKKQCFYLRHEKRFLGFLVLAVGNDYLIMSKVSLSDLLKVRPDMNKKAKAPARVKLLNQKVDYVLCDKKTAEILCAIDLFDKEQINPNYLNHCIARHRLFQSAGLPWVRIPIRLSYQVPSIKKLIKSVINQQRTEEKKRPPEEPSLLDGEAVTRL